MLNGMLKVIPASITAVMIVGTASAAFAYQDPASRLGDRYPFLEPGYWAMAAERFAVSAAVARRGHSTGQSTYRDPASKLADRYPFLERGYRTTAARRHAASAAVRQRTVKYSQVQRRDPASKIGDRYPFLERRVAGQYMATRFASSEGNIANGNIR